MKPTREQLEAIKVGDRITFRSALREGNRKATRIVNGFYGDYHYPTVRYAGNPNFAVLHMEIISIEPGYTKERYWKRIRPEIIEHLRQLGRAEIAPKNRAMGLCSELYNLFRIHFNPELTPYFRTWEEYSGYLAYPIPAFSDVGPPSAYYQAQSAKNLWAANPYGDARRRLCLHIANEIEKELEEEKRHVY